MKFPLGIYVHIPFCSNRCDYCDFATWVGKEHLVQIYIDALINQLTYHAKNESVLEEAELISIFFGGGTPNFIDSKYIVQILESINDVISINENVEITVECNPDFLNQDKLKAYIKSGVNRISLGVQSMDPKVLEFIGRRHNPNHVYNSVDLIKNSEINNYSCDLIYGSSVESLQSWETTLNEIIDLGPNHISAYALGIEKGTPLGIDVSNGLKKVANEDEIADKYLLADQIFNEAGYGWYEISNWAKMDYESKHNNLYWTGGNIIALGCAAHGNTNGKRWSTPRNIEVYIEDFSGEIKPRSFKAHLNSSSFIDDSQMDFSLRLRTKKGVPSLGLDSKQIQPFIDEDLIFVDHDSISLTPKGRLLEHEISIELYKMMNKS